MKKVLLILMAFLMIVSLTGCSYPEYKQPYEWCEWEIAQEERYDGCSLSWVVQDVDSPDIAQYGNCYIIAVITDTIFADLLSDDAVVFDYWYCFIEYNPNRSIGSQWKSGILREQITALDCDLFKTEYIDCGAMWRS